MEGHHLILGKLVDFITGMTIDDTHDERYRQELSRLLVEQKGYLKKEIDNQRELLIKAGDKKAVIRVDFCIRLDNRIAMIIRYAPGSIVTRIRPVLAMSRLVESYQIPVVVVTNGKDAQIIDGETGKIISSEIESIPCRAELVRMTEHAEFKPVSLNRAEMESRIVYAYEVDGSCTCDNTICRL